MQGMIPTEPQTVGIQLKAGPIAAGGQDVRSSEIGQGKSTALLGIGILAVGFLTRSFLLGITGIIVIAVGWSRVQRWENIPQDAFKPPGPGIVIDLSTGVATVANIPNCAAQGMICNGKI